MRRVCFAILAAAVIAGPASADGFCDTLKAVAAASPTGFKALRGKVDMAAHTSSFDTYTARRRLPGAKDCGVVVPNGVDLGAPTYSCAFSGQPDLHAQLAALAGRVAQCTGARITAPPLFKPSDDGISYGFTHKGVRYQVSSTKGPGGHLTANLEIRPPTSDDD